MILANLTVTDEDVQRVLAYRRQQDLPRDWQDFLDFLAEHLSEALRQHVHAEIRYLADVYLDQE